MYFSLFALTKPAPVTLGEGAVCFREILFLKTHRSSTHPLDEINYAKDDDAVQ